MDLSPIPWEGDPVDHDEAIKEADAALKLALEGFLERNQKNESVYEATLWNLMALIKRGERMQTQDLDKAEHCFETLKLELVKLKQAKLDQEADDLN